MKKNKLSLMIICATVITIIGIMVVFIIFGRSVKNAGEAGLDTDFDNLEDTLIDEKFINDISLENGTDIESLFEFPIYYHFVSDVDEASVYLGGVGGIYKVDNESRVQIIYSAPHIAGAALYGDYVFSLEYNVIDNGLITDLIRINKDGSDKEIMTQVSSESYDLKIIDNMLIMLSENICGYETETVFQYYILDDEGNLASSSPIDVYGQFELPDGYGDDMNFLINPMFSTKYFGYSCFIRTVRETDINSVWIRKMDEKSTEEVVTCSGEPLVAEDRIFYCDSDGAALVQHSLDNSQETVLYEIPDDSNLLLLTYDSEWIYVIRKPSIYESNELPSYIMRVNLRDCRTEEIYELQVGSYISNFNVYGNNCFFILSSANNISSWECCNLTDFTITTIH